MESQNDITKTNMIITYLNKLDNNIKTIKRKIISINTLYKKLETNKILLQEPNSNLIFQSNMLKNEHDYYNNMYKLILNKYSSDIQELAEYIMMILISLKEIEINNQDKIHIFSKIIKIKKYNYINYGIINEIINTTINNLKLIDEFIKLFDNYIEKFQKTNNKYNNHTSNFEITIKYKKQILLIEYTKNCDKFNKTIDYYNEVLSSIINQIDNSKLLNYFLQEKST